MGLEPTTSSLGSGGTTMDCVLQPLDSSSRRPAHFLARQGIGGDGAPSAPSAPSGPHDSDHRDIAWRFESRRANSDASGTNLARDGPRRAHLRCNAAFDARELVFRRESTTLGVGHSLDDHVLTIMRNRGTLSS
jgi:hypothetical protein